MTFEENKTDLSIFNALLKSFVTKLFLATLFFCAFFESSFAAGKSTGLGRNRSCNQQGEPEGINFNPYTGGKDAEFVLSNPTCIAIVTSSYAAVKGSIAAMNSLCGTGSAMPRITPSPLLDSIDIAKASIKGPTDAKCQAGVRAASLSFDVAILMLKITSSIADYVFNNSKICGDGWIGPNPKNFTNNNPNYKKKVEDEIQSYIEDPLLKSKLNFGDQYYREWYYGGAEVEDNPDSGDYCPDVSQPQQMYQKRICTEYFARNSSGYRGSGMLSTCKTYKTITLARPYPPQKYYLRGLETGNYNCKKYDILPTQNDPRDGKPITKSRLREYRDAFECCKKRSQQYICIDYAGTQKFCQAGSRCEINGIHFEAKSRDNGRLICAETYSLCPYNFYLGGGAETCDYFQDGAKDSNGIFRIISVEDVAAGNCASKSEIRNADCSYNNKAGKCRNYCQYMKHCTVTNATYQYRSNISSAYFSTACLDFIGDSQNRISYGTGFVAGSARHFSAPIAQCVKETLENSFYNRAGHHRCLLDSDTADSSGVCEHGTDYKKGDQVQAESFFSRLQKALRAVVKMILTLAIVSYGIKTLIGGGVIKKPELAMFVIKIALIMYFSLGLAWQTMFFDGVYSASSVFAQMIFKLQTPNDEEKRDGCQFGRITKADGEVISASNYPAGKEYLAIWDTLDCKMARYLGFGPEASTANIAKLIFAGFITGAPGIYFSLSLLIFGIAMVSCVIRALHIFLSSSIAILLMVYVSPLVICSTLFSKTQNIFKGWATNLISFVLQPIILFAYLAVFISIMDKTLTGSASFHGPAPNRLIFCKSYCTDASKQKVTMQESLDCSRVGDVLNMPKVDSFACMIDVNAFDNWPGLELIGISVPFIIDIFTDHTKEKILTILKSALIIFFLFQFMDEIPGITSQLVGGSKLATKNVNPVKKLMEIAGMARAVQKRANRATKSVGSKAKDFAKKRASQMADAVGNQGKSVKDSGSDGNASDAAGSSSASLDGANSGESSTDGAGSKSKPVDGANSGESKA